MATNRQKQWRGRGQLLWRLKGFNLGYFMRDALLTPQERECCNTILRNQEWLIEHFSSNSKQLGFNVKEKKDE